MSDRVNIFISYARKDGRDSAELLYKALTNRGIQAWRDERDLNPYQDFSVSIERAIRKSTHLLVYLTPSIIRREDSFVRREIIYAQGFKKPIIPLLSEEFKSEDIPILINHLTWMRIQKLEITVDELINRIQSAKDIYQVPNYREEPFRKHLERLIEFVISELENSMLDAEHILTLKAVESNNYIRQEILPAYKPRRPAWFHSNMSSNTREYDNIFEALNDQGSPLLILGDGGSGKTTSLLALAREMAIERLVNGEALLPIYVPIGAWDGKTDLIEWVAKATGLQSSLLIDEINLRHVILLLDGLDELDISSKFSGQPNTLNETIDYRIEFLRRLSELKYSFVVVSSREEIYKELLLKGNRTFQFEKALTLKNLENEHLKIYLKDHPELFAMLRSEPQLMNIVRIPLLLVILVIAYQDSTLEEREKLRHFRSSPGELREKIFEAYIEKRYEWEAKRSSQSLPFEIEDLYETLGKVGCGVLGNLTTLDKQSLFLELLKQYLGERADTFVNFGIAIQLLKKSDDNTISFIHDLFRDFFVFRYSVSILEHDDINKRFEALVSLGFIRDQRAIEPIFKAVKNQGNPLPTGMALSMFGSAIIPHLKNEVNNRTASIRIAAVSALYFLKDESSKGIFLKCIYDRNPSVRMLSIKALSDLKYRKALPDIISLLDDKNTDVRLSAAEALGKMRSKKSIDPLVFLLDDKSRRVQWTAAASLALLGDFRAFSKIIDALKTENGLHLVGVVEALGDIGDRRAIEPLLTTLSKKSKPDDLELFIEISIAKALRKFKGKLASSQIMAGWAVGKRTGDTQLAFIAGLALSDEDLDTVFTRPLRGATAISGDQLV